MRGTRGPGVRRSIFGARRDPARLQLAPARGEFARGRPRGLAAARELPDRGHALLHRRRRSDAGRAIRDRTPDRAHADPGRGSRIGRIGPVRHRSCGGLSRPASACAEPRGWLAQPLRDPDLLRHPRRCSPLVGVRRPARQRALGRVLSHFRGHDVWRCPAVRGCVRRGAEARAVGRVDSASFDRERLRLDQRTIGPSSVA